MRQILAGAAAVSGVPAVSAVAGLWPARRVLAHHGYLGKHDFSRPLFVAGRITRAYIGLPHGRLTLAVPQPVRLPRDTEYMRAIEDAELRPTLSFLGRWEGTGNVTIVLDARMTRILMEQPDRLRVGDAVEAIVYPRTSGDEYRDELRAALLVLVDGRVLVSSAQVRP